jgi:hypothetical protein
MHDHLTISPLQATPFMHADRLFPPTVPRVGSRSPSVLEAGRVCFETPRVLCTVAEKHVSLRIYQYVGQDRRHATMPTVRRRPRAPIQSLAVAMTYFRTASRREEGKKTGMASHVCTRTGKYRPRSHLVLAHIQSRRPRSSA